MSRHSIDPFASAVRLDRVLERLFWPSDVRYRPGEFRYHELILLCYCLSLTAAPAIVNTSR